MELTLLELDIKPDLSGASLYAPFARAGPTESGGSGHDTAGPAGGPGPFAIVAVAVAIAAIALWRLAHRDDADA